ncbi:MAG: cell division protein FtsQ/DivIB [Candidatus Omnitrophota bacterium]|jgi:cell division septal protein FtsQ
MARKRKNSNESAKQLNEFVKKNKAGIAVFAAAAIALTIAAFWLNNFFLNSPSFSVDKIEIVKPGREGAYRLQKDYFRLEYPVNIFTADPSVLSGKIKDRHPEYQIVVITKFLPDRIAATIKDRAAVARIKVAKVLPIDFDGVVVSDTGSMESLPLITGLESQLANPKSGTKVKSKRLSTALSILRQVYSRAEFRGSFVATVDVSYPEKAFFVIDGMDIVLGSGDTGGKLDVLASVFNDPKLDKSRIGSIDLRFTDPVVTFKPEKK